MRDTLSRPGLYSWWVDEAGAVDLSGGLGHEVKPGSIHVGQAGATRIKSGKPSGATLWSRLIRQQAPVQCEVLDSSASVDDLAHDADRVPEWGELQVVARGDHIYVSRGVCTHHGPHVGRSAQTEATQPERG